MSTAPFFSILVPTYNHAKFVGAALDSLVAQTDRDWEAVVVNDGSTDNTADVLNAYAQRHPRIRVFHKANGGTGSALNRALSEARGAWICWLSSDDFFDPNKLALHRGWIQRDPRCRFYFTYFRLFHQAAGTTVDHQLWGPLPPREFQVLGLFYRNYISGISICIHRESWQAVGRFNERLRYAQDYDMWLRLLARHPATFMPEWTCINRHHSGQYSEIFPQACYYDTAAAGVQFLNDHRFEQLFPMLDLSAPTSAMAAVERALTQAADASAFLYWYGAHPCLLARTLEWAWDRNLGPDVFQQREPARRLARQIVADFARQLRGTSLGWHWQVAAAATDLPDVDFTCTPMRPVDVGLGLLHEQRADGKTDFADLQRYFKLQYDLELPAAPAKLARRTVAIVGAQNSQGDTETALQLHAAGCRVVAITAGDNRFTHVDGIPKIEANSRQFIERIVSKLAPTDAIVWDQMPNDLAAFPSKHHLFANEKADSTLLIRQILEGAPAKSQRPRLENVALRGSRQKVVFIGRSPWGGGAERVTHDLVHGLDPHKYEIHLVHLFCNSGHQINFAPEIKMYDLGQEIARIHSAAANGSRPLWRRVLNRLSRWLSSASQSIGSLSQAGEFTQDLDPLLTSIRNYSPLVVALRNILHRIGPDAILIPIMEEATACTWLARAFAHQPYCASLHTAESYYFPVLYPDPNRLLAERFLFSNACRDAAVVTIPSHGCKRDLVQYCQIPESLIDVVPNPLDCNAIALSSLATPEIALPPLHGKTLFVHAARLDVQKNHQLLLGACQLLRKHGDDFFVACLGEGDQHRILQRQIDELGLQNHVYLYGPVKNPFAYFSRAHGLVLTSNFESFALVLAEALACGAVPISVDCPYGPREVLDGGAFGLLVPPENPAALANAMLRVIQDRALRQRHIDLGPAYAQKYNLPNIIVHWERIIDKIKNQANATMNSQMKAA